MAICNLIVIHVVIYTGFDLYITHSKFWGLLTYFIGRYNLHELNFLFVFDFFQYKSKFYILSKRVTVYPKLLEFIKALEAYVTVDKSGMKAK